MTRFSRRLGAWDSDADASQIHSLEEATRRLRADGAAFVDLCETNPTRVGLASTAEVLRILASVDASTYAPDPLGLVSARDALAGWLGAPHRSERSFLTASTSEAYTWIFKLLADPGDEILVPAPSYPLFGYLADLEGVATRTFPLVLDDAFSIDQAALAEVVTERTRALVVVNPNNPTGHFVDRADYEALDDLAADRGIALVIDEVFASFAPSTPAPHKLVRAATFSRRDGAPRRALTFVMGGLSKSLASPQLKLAWTHVFGPEDAVREALSRVEWIADTFLSVGTPIQCALPRILEVEPQIRDELCARIAANVAWLRDTLARSGGAVSALPFEGGWSVLLRVPRIFSDDELALRLLTEARVRVMPGAFFGFPREGYLVVSTIVSPEAFVAGVSAILAFVAQHEDPAIRGRAPRRV